MLIDTTNSLKIADFGLAKTEEFKQGITCAGEAIGSPAYMSPEQIRGKNLDGKSDLYSVGILLFELLTGALPFNGATWVELGTKICNEPFPSLNSKRRSSNNRALDTFLAKACAKNTQERFQSAEEMQAAALNVLLRIAKNSEKSYNPQISNILGRIEDSVIKWKAPLLAGFSVVFILSAIGTSSSGKHVTKLEEKVQSGSNVLESLTTSVRELTAVAIEAHANREKISNFIAKKNKEINSEVLKAEAVANAEVKVEKEKNAQSDTQDELVSTKDVK